MKERIFCPFTSVMTKGNILHGFSFTLGKSRSLDNSCVLVLNHADSCLPFLFTA